MSPPSASPLSELRRLVHTVPDADVAAARRQRVLAHLEAVRLREQRARSSLRRRRGTLVAMLAAAALIALVVGGRRGVAPQPAAEPVARATLLAGRVRPALPDEGLDLSRESVLATTADGPAELQLPSLARVHVAPASRLSLRRRQRAGGGAAERIRLRDGRVELDVPRLAPNQTLEVETHDAVVVVRGTRFSVDWRHRDGRGFSRVAVAEGSVSVQSAGETHRLTAGESWTSLPQPAAPSREPSIDPEPVVSAPSAPSRVAPQRRSPTAGKSALAEQNRLLQAAQLARRNGMAKLALDRFERLIRDFPQSELAHNARVERFRLLAESGDRAGARRAALDYLRRHPDGFAFEEASKLAESGP